MNQRDQRRRNRENILGLLRVHPGISQVELSAKARLQPSTTSNLVRNFRELGLVNTVGKGSSGPHGGKRAELLAVRPDFGCYGGIYIKNDEIIFGVTDFDGTLVARRQANIDPNDNRKILSVVIDEINASCRRYPRYRATGVAVSSVVSLDGDVSPSADFTHTLPGMIPAVRAQTGNLPLTVDNDANCAAFWDYYASRERYRNLVHLQVQTTPVTIGAGIILDGALYRGVRGGAGELNERLPRELSPDVLVSNIDRLVRFLGTFLDTEAVFIAGELNGETFERLHPLERDGKEAVPFIIDAIENQDVPMLGASLQAIGLHIDSVLGEQ
ncbi:MAG TPA: ROK family transcriptional regulator [Spirochaetia bacterium]|nr:ROK family transcriptional regulator [Spirochaetia bacterium]